MDSSVSFIHTLREANVDPLLLLYLTAPRRIVESKPFLVSLLGLHFEKCMVPFVERISALFAPLPATDIDERLRSFCSVHHLEFIKGSAGTVDAFFNIVEAHILSLPAATYLSLEASLCTARQAAHAGFKNFLPAVADELRQIRLISPTTFVEASKKDRAREEYDKRKEQWGIHAPFFFQTYDADEQTGMAKGSSIFYIYRTAADGLHRLLEMLTVGATSLNGKVRQVKGALEHALDEDTLCYPIMDWEAMEEFFGGRCSRTDILMIMKEFPEIFLGDLSQMGILGNDPVQVYYKNKSRDTRKGHKMSMHFVLNVLGRRAHHNVALTAFVETRGRDGFSKKDWIDKAKEASDRTDGRLPLDFPSVPGGVHDFLFDPYTAVYPLDYKAGRSNGFSIAFSRKALNDSFSEFWGRTAHKRGCPQFESDNPKQTQFPCPFHPPHDLFGAHLNHASRLWMMHEQCYTTPKAESVCYEETFMAAVDTSIKQVSLFFCSHRDSNPSPLTSFCHLVGAGGGGSQASRPQQLLRSDGPAGMAAVSAGEHDGQGDL